MTTEPGHGRKRQREVNEVSETPNPGRTQLADGEQPKRIRSSPSVTSFVPLPFVVVHRVECSRVEQHHEHHVPSADYLDVPRLLAQSNRKTCLQGQDPIKDIEGYLEDRNNLSFAIYITYSCTRYYETIKDDFKRLRMPTMDENVAIMAKPFFYVLEQDAQPATAESEALILSEGLQDALHVLETHPSGFRWNWNDQSSLMYPYLQLYHQRDLLVDDTTHGLKISHRSHVDALHTYLLSRLGPAYLEAETLFARGSVDRQHWAKLFRPGAVVVTVKNGQPVAFICESCPTQSNGRLLLQCWSWAFDGKFFQNKVVLNISWPSGNDIVAITDLQVYPLEYAVAGLDNELRARGEVFWACRSRKFVNYDVPLEGMEVQISNLRYMIDMTTYKLMHGDEGDEEPPAPRNELPEHEMRAEVYPAEPFILLLPATVRGYGFHNKKWSRLLVKHIRDVSWNKDIFEKRLVLSEDKKELIHALITVHAGKQTAIRTEFMAGKGEGLIILLHGGPGTGKTLTAESVAELAQRPLYRVTCGDIGTEPQSVEEYLKSVLWIGSTWGCVVLLDEADVFLEERTKMYMQRNALVSVFLRVLEYYDGILILTTNRIGTFDEAFKSRIQLALHYPPLNEKDRKGVWRNFFRSLSQAGEVAEFENIEEKLPELSEIKLNGRQIRNTINNARQLARHWGQTLAYKHIDKALKVVVDFEEYVSDVHGHDDEEHARDIGNR
ncbi:P-loop containing nucleoside triphosphate hydrolase protein [Ophiobolus disseminans]|uniref:P-loop containing nucleoside triphosphate hydrolase protein n=1 Tax=Ophiobolus disseminans TaxID=1469910 RepID=A0A6A7AMW7_9PLEO|nr:P-loop containing nucleoside triphosphate hydrolase protein [Ophiobolus disseminans]